jgi:lysyl-tRNA synthetase class 2
MSAHAASQATEKVEEAEGAEGAEAAKQGKKGKKGNNGQKGSSKKDESSSSISEIRASRIAKAESLISQGQSAYAYSFSRSHSASQLQALYENLPNGEQDDSVSVSVAGRIMMRRVMGKLAFAKLTDQSGSIQLYLDKKLLEEFDHPESFKNFKSLVDAGDIVGVSGGLRRTDKGELSVVVKKLDVLTKAVLPLPDKFHGLTDVESRYRKRYLDMIVTPGVADTLKARSLTVSTIRRELENLEFTEVETPVLESSAGGADARPFVTYHNTLERDFTLRIATELHLKRLVVGGLERVFEIGRIFRNEGISARHNPEFTSIELYEAYADYYDMMDLTEKLIRTASEKVAGGLKVEYQGTELDFGTAFRRVSMHELVKEKIGVDFLKYLQGGDLEDAKSIALNALEQANGVEDLKNVQKKISEAPSVGHVLNELFEELVESTLIQPTFVMDHPVEISPLAKPHRSQTGLVERFELFVAGRELANSFSELTDPVEQRARLEAQVANHSRTEEDPEKDYEIKVDEDFLAAIEQGMPPTGGMGMGIDRLVMLLTDSPSIRDVIAFPLMK